MNRLVTAVVGLLVFGAAKLPFERNLMREQRAAHFHQAEVNIDLREKLSQGAFIAVLSGARALVADISVIRAQMAWENTEWGRVKLFYDVATSVQPRATQFWDLAAWHMAVNASVAALEDPNQPREALRIKAQREYFKLGEDYLLRGIKFNPDRAVLFDRLGLLYQDKFKDPCKAAWAYGEAAKHPEALPYCRRLAAYNLSRCPGHEREGYERLKQLYNMGPDERLPTLLKRIDELQDKLNIPPAERIDTSADKEALRKAGF